MSDADRSKWNERFRSGQYRTRTHATQLLEGHLPNLPRGRALDVACGAGRNSLSLARNGYSVDAIDISAEGIERGRAAAAVEGLIIDWHEADLESGLASIDGLQPPYDLVVMIRYVNLPIIHELLGLLSDSGVFLSEQHLNTSQDVIGPNNPAYRFESNALLAAVTGMRVLFYREGIVEDPDGRRASLAQVIATRSPAIELEY